jgi:hypothetical protein
MKGSNLAFIVPRLNAILTYDTSLMKRSCQSIVVPFNSPIYTPPIKDYS